MLFVILGIEFSGEGYQGKIIGYHRKQHFLFLKYVILPTNLVLQCTYVIYGSRFAEE